MKKRDNLGIMTNVEKKVPHFSKVQQKFNIEKWLYIAISLLFFFKC